MCYVWYNRPLLRFLYALFAKNASRVVRQEEAGSAGPKKHGAAGIGETAELDWRSVPWEVAMHWNETRVYCEPHSALNINRASCTLRRKINSDSSANGCCHIDVTVKWKEKTVRLKAEWKYTTHSHSFQIPFSVVQRLPWMAHGYSVGQESTCF
jgi:hypothetical protein